MCLRHNIPLILKNLAGVPRPYFPPPPFRMCMHVYGKYGPVHETTHVLYTCTCSQQHQLRPGIGLRLTYVVRYVIKEPNLPGGAFNPVSQYILSSRYLTLGYYTYLTLSASSLMLWYIISDLCVCSVSSAARLIVDYLLRERIQKVLTEYSNQLGSLSYSFQRDSCKISVHG